MSSLQAALEQAQAAAAAAAMAAFLASLMSDKWYWYDLERDKSVKLGMTWDDGGGGESPFENEGGDIDIETVGKGGGGGKERLRELPSIVLVGVNIGGGLLCCCCCEGDECSLK